MSIECPLSLHGHSTSLDRHSISVGGHSTDAQHSVRLVVYEVTLRYDLTDTAGVLENKVLGMFHGLDD